MAVAGENGAVIEALGFAGGTLSQAGRDWLAGLGPVQEDTIARGRTVRCWAGPGPGLSVPPRPGGGADRALRRAALAARPRGGDGITAGRLLGPRSAARKQAAR